MKQFRPLLLWIAFGIAGVAATAAESKPTAIPDVGSGRLAWFDLTTTNLARAKVF